MPDVVALELQLNTAGAVQNVQQVNKALSDSEKLLEEMRTKFDENSKEIADLKAQITGLKEKLEDAKKSNDGVTGSYKNLRQEVKAATIELQNAQKQYGFTSKEALNAAKSLAELKDRQKEATEVAGLFDPGAKFAAFGNVVRTVTGGFSALTGAMALFGAQSEDVQKTLLKVQAALAITEGVNTIADSAKEFERLGAIIKSTSAYKVIDNGLTIIATRLQLLFAGSVDTTAASFGVLKVAIAATGIGLLVVGVLALTGAFNSVSKAAEEAAHKQKLYDDIVKDGANGYTEAYTQVAKLKAEFAAAGTNVYKQKKALEDFNSTVGDSTKQMKSFSDAQAFLSSDTETNTYIQSMLNRAKATAAVGKAAAASLDVDTIEKKLQDTQNKLNQMKGPSLFYSAEKKQLIQDLEDQKNALDVAKKDLDFYTYYVNKSVAEDGVTFSGGVKKAYEDANAAAQKANDDALAAALAALTKKTKLQSDTLTIQGKGEMEQQALQEQSQQQKIALLQTYLTKAQGLGEDYYNAAKKQVKAAEDELTIIQSNALVARFAAIKTLTENLKKDLDAVPPPVSETVDEKRANGEIPQDHSGDATGSAAAIQRAKDRKDIEDKNRNDALDDTSKGYKDQLDAVDEYQKQKYTLIAGNADAEAALAEDVARQKKKIAQDENDFKLGLIASFADQAADIVGRDTVAGKAFAIASATINTYLGATKALSTLPPPFSFIQAGLTIVAGLKSVASIVATQVPGHASSGSVPSAPSFAPPPLVPQTPQVSNTQLNQDQLNKIGNATVRAYVVEADVASNTEKIARLNRAARLGG